MSVYRNYIKRGLDLVVASLGIIATAPFTIPVSISLCIALRSTRILFIQPRPGRNGRIFNILKFKTMTDQRDASGALLPDSCRVTPIGNFLRKTSIDELPQLWNVLRGDMSIIGPRPLLVQYLSLYNDRQRHRHDVRPGITGWAQCNGRNALNWSDRFEHDLWYIEHISFATDCRILYKTIINTLFCKDVVPIDNKPFLGN